MRKINLLFLIITLALTHLLKAKDTIEFINDKELMDISSSLLIYEDKSGDLSFQEVKEKEFTLTKSVVPNLGISKSYFWVKIPITNKTNTEHLFLELSLPILDYIEFYYPPDNNKFKVIKTGDEFEFKKREYKDPNYLFDLNIKKNETKTFYLKLRSNEAVQLPIKIGKKSNIYNQIKNRDILSGIYFGVMLVMIFYNLFLSFSVKDKSYLYYVVYIICILLTQTSLQGYTFQYLWPNNPTIGKYSLIIFPSLSGMTGMFFMNVFLKTKEYSVRLYRISIFLVLPYLFSIIISFFNIFDLSQIIIQLNSGIISLYLLITPIIIYRKGFEPAKYFIVAWSVFLIGVFIFIFKDLEILPFNNFTRYTMQIGSGVETILLSFALAARINIYKKERLEALEEKERIVREQNIILEEKVKERTKELNQALTNLKQTQSQLVDAEKMSSLGQLTAGIAHEINNPINFVSSSISPLRRDISDIESIIKKYEEISLNDDLEEKLKEVEALKKEIDYEYLKTELDTIITSIEDGAERTKEIVSSLRNFSRLDETEIQKANINEGIESTLVLLKNKLNGIVLYKELKQLPSIECYPSKLNQAFMNIIDNAIGAIKDKGLKSGEGNININTDYDEQYVYITIKDNGIGIDEKIKDKIFEPFFTTKDVGKGTGLGLSIVYSIIESHNGEISVESNKNEGTQFMIKIPNKG